MKIFEYESSHDECIYKIRAGQNAQENWDLIDDSAQNDIWFHVANESSTHVVLTVGDRKKKPHRSVIKFCAIKCKEGSKVKNLKNVEITYTEIKNVHIDRTDSPGTVTSSVTKSIKI